MGRGDKTTKKGKIFKGSYGVKRPKRKSQSHKSWARKKVRFVPNHDREDSNLVNQGVFPILSMNSEGNYYFIGTGFFINQHGWFITAKHVAFENDDVEPINPFIAIQIINETQFQQRLVQGFWMHPTADIIVGIFFPLFDNMGDRLTNPSVFLKKKEIKVGKEIFTYAYPDTIVEAPQGRFQIASFLPNYYFGRVTHKGRRNDNFFQGRYLQTNMLVKGGASGGPVFNNEGFVIGVNTSGYDLTGKGDPISFLTPIQYAFEIEVPFGNEVPSRMVRLSELIELGGIETD